MRIHYYTSPQGQTESGLSLTEVKKRIRKHGGSGYTEHFDRDGSFQESTPIILGNNARTTYNAEYNTSRKFRTTQQEHADKAQIEPNVNTILQETYEQAKKENIGEEDNDRLMAILGPKLGEHIEKISETWLEWALSYIHARLYHEYRGLNRSLSRNKAIKNWKETMKKEVLS